MTQNRSTDLKKKFKLYVVTNDISLGDFAHQLGISYHFLYQIMLGKKEATEEMSKKIEEITKGYITFKELRFCESKFCPTCGKKIRKDYANSVK